MTAVLIRLHRYLGIGLCLLVVLWFASGIVMVFANDMPRVTDDTRLARLAPLDPGTVRIAPAEALGRAGLGTAPPRITLTTLLDRPVYRLGQRTLYADTGERLAAIDAATAQAVAARFAGVTETQARATARLTTPDQWTITERRSLPLHKVVVDDDRGTVVYVSEQTGEVAVATSRRSRLLAMAGAIPHWLYLTPLRTQNALWRQVILWTSGLTCLLAVTGLVVGWLQSLRAIIGRRAVTLHRGWMKWHHVTGLAFGLSTLTWAFSGFLSMDPWAWASDDSDTEARIAAALSGGPIDLTRFPRLDGPEAATAGFTAIRAKEVELAWIQDTPHFVVLTGTGPATVLDAAAFHRRPPFRLESFLLRVAQAVPEASITDTRLQDTYDAYYYARNAPPLPGSRPLPVVRMTLSDNSWLYIDPSTGRLIRRVTERRRVERWLYNGLHSLDFPFWYQRQWLWRTGVIALLSGGLLLGLIGVVIAIRRFTPAKA